MTRVTWGNAGDFVYHAGVDRGMFYYGGYVAVPWNGLTNVSEAPTGADPTAYYLDGQKITDVPGGEDFAGTIQAFSAPFEFTPCAGSVQLSPGLFATDQFKHTFSFSYRTLVGNDVQGIAFAYKVHVVYNATAQTSDFVHATITDTPNVNAYSWAVTTVPPDISGYRPTAHFVIDTRFVDPILVSQIEALLYGDDNDDPSFPSAQTLATLLTVQTVTWWDLDGLTDFPDTAVDGDLGVDFSTGNLYAEDVAPVDAYWWDLTGLTDFPDVAEIGEWGIDLSTGQVWENSA